MALSNIRWLCFLCVHSSFFTQRPQKKIAESAENRIYLALRSLREILLSPLGVVYIRYVILV